MAGEPEAPERPTWRVRRRWIPHRRGIGLRARFSRRRLRRAGERLADGADIPVIDCWEGLVVGLVVVAGIVLVVLFGWPLVLLLLDVVWLVAAVLVGVVARALLGRPWRVEAIGPDGERCEWNVVGFRAAGRKRDEVRRRLRAGAPLDGGERLSRERS